VPFLVLPGRLVLRQVDCWCCMRGTGRMAASKATPGTIASGLDVRCAAIGSKEKIQRRSSCARAAWASSRFSATQVGGAVTLLAPIRTRS
jgi:hypothetical protein